MNTENWKWFKLGNLFQEIYKAKAHVKQEVNITDDTANGLIFISRTETNNGCDVFIERDDSIIVEAGNAIIIGDTTATCFYQEKEFTTGDHIIVCRSNWLNKYTALFFKTIMDNEKYRFNYGRAFKMELVKEHKIKLPTITNEQGETVPDWQWMEEYVKNVLLPKLPENARQVWEKRYNNKPLSSQKLELKTDEWKWFRYDEIFEIKKGFFNKKPEESGLGTIPFIGATDSNNGVTSWYTKDEIDSTPKAENTENVPLNEKMFESPCITVSNNGSVGYAFYQSQPFTCSHDVNPLYLRDKKVNLSPSLALFLCGVIECEQFRWTYGRKWRPERMPKSLIKLPINKGGQPDWQWMEDYIKGLPYSGCL